MDNNTRHCSVFNPDFSETVAYNNPLFPAYVVYGFLSSYPDYSSVSHWHKDLEFILIKKGTMAYNVNGRLIGLEEGSGIIVNSRQLHYGFSAEHNECEFICILLSPELLLENSWFYQSSPLPLAAHEIMDCPVVFFVDAQIPFSRRQHFPDYVTNVPEMPLLGLLSMQRHFVVVMLVINFFL